MAYHLSQKWKRLRVDNVWACYFTLLHIPREFQLLQEGSISASKLNLDLFNV